MSKRVCSEPGCPVLIDKAGHCTEHAREHDQARGTKTQRGYGPDFQRERKRWARTIARTPVPCTRCHAPITTGMAWDLGHSDDRTTLTGPEHQACNRSAAGKASHIS